MPSNLFNRERAARVLSDALDMGDAKAAEKHDVTVRSVTNYRRRLETDKVFADLFRRLRHKSDAGWQANRIRALRGGLDKMQELIGKATDPEHLPAVTKAVQVLGELQVTSEALGVGELDAREGGHAAPAATDAGEEPAIH